MSTVHAARPYQVEVERLAWEAWETVQNVMIVLPTGAGKSFVAASIMSKINGPVCAIAHRQELVTQISLALAREGVRHRIIGSVSVQRACSAEHMERLGRDFISPTARVAVASVDTLIRLPADDPFFTQVVFWFTDEGHHLITGGGFKPDPEQANKWGKCALRFVNAKGLLVTATPIRADGKGLGRQADGLVDRMIVGPSMRDLIDLDYLCDYRIIAKQSDLRVSEEWVTASGDYSREKLSAARQASSVTGDVVEHYLRYAAGKLGVTFDVDVTSATQTAAAFRARGVPAEVVSAKTPDEVRRAILRKFRNRELLQLVNVDLFGEGFDLPAIEVVSMARPTQSYGLYCLDPETEVLTPRGWERWDTAVEATEVIAFDMETGSCRSAAVTGAVKRELYDDEQIFGAQGPHLDIAVSDQHDMIVMGNSGTCVNWRKQKAIDVAQRQSMFKIPVAAFGTFDGSGLSDDELRFLGWFLSDGSLNKRTGAITISQSVKKVNHLKSIRDCIVGCGFKFTESLSVRKNCPPTHNDLKKFTISRGEPRGRDRHLSGWGRLGQWVDKSLPICYDRITRKELLTLLETINLGDGTNDHGSLDYIKATLTIACGDNKRFSDRLQAICVQRGLRCNINKVQYGDGSPWYYAHIRDTRIATLPGTGVTDGIISGNKPYKRTRFKELLVRPEFLWCLTNELGTLITRRNGKVAIVGNCQQFGRALRIMDGKVRAIIIDHVGNVARHGLPDAPREWSLDRRERRSSSAAADAIPTRTCLNPAGGLPDGLTPCCAVYERFYKACPHCGFPVQHADRSKPEFVDGDLVELSPEALARLRGGAKKFELAPAIPMGATWEIKMAVHKRHAAGLEQQVALRQAMNLWSGWQAHLGRGTSEQDMRFFHTYRTDRLSAQALGAKEASALAERLRADLAKANVMEKTT
jgi:superfamily II DNA or RNA helicase